MEIEKKVNHLRQMKKISFSFLVSVFLSPIIEMKGVWVVWKRPLDINPNQPQIKKIFEA